MKESNLSRLIALAVGKLRTTVLFRNNVGTGWIGKKKIVQSSGMIYVKKGDMIIEDPRPLQAGLCNGSSDHIGWTVRTITPEMVGKNVAVFTAIEVKTGSKLRSDQLNFIQQVKAAGGIAGVANDPDEAVGLIQNQK